MTTNYGTGVIILDNTSDDILDGKFMVARVVFLSESGDGRATVTDRNGQIVASAIMASTYAPTVTIDVYHSVQGLQADTLPTGAEAHVYLKEW